MKEDQTILRASGIGKLYSRNAKSTSERMASVANRAIFGLRPKPIGMLREKEFWSVKNVSFTLQRGEAIGVIGLNGSGKTTLLRMLAGQLLPDAGEIWIDGSSAAMIDLQAGFQASATGRENIYLRAAALGFTRKMAREAEKAIIEFSELEDAIDAAVSTYSSGMKMRLAFSVMAMVAPDVLLIDEVLAVGDFRFRQKCLAKIREMRARSAFVFVSHSMGDISRFCDRVIVLHKGRVHFEGPPDEAIAIYETIDADTAPNKSEDRLKLAMGPVFENNDAISKLRHYWIDDRHNTVDEIEFDQPARLHIQFTPNFDIRKLVVGIPMWNENAHYTTGVSTQSQSEPFHARKGEPIALTLELEPGVMNPGLLNSMLTILDGAEFLIRRSNPPLRIRSPRHPTWGAVTVPHKWVRS